MLEGIHHCVQRERAAFLQGFGFGVEDFVGKHLEVFAQAGFLLLKVSHLASMAGLTFVLFSLELGVLTAEVC
ncbi:hypothetical protein D3C80_2117620 [compost metagenome]